MTAESVVLAGKYRLTAVIGRGGMGTVWRAEHLGFDAPVAIKLIDPRVIESAGAGAVQRFHNEARAAAALRSPHVVQVLDYGVDEATGSPFIAMELLEGENLARRLRRVGKLGFAETSRLVTHIARALVRAHERGIVHRDLKPANVFIIHNEDEEVAKVLDFGTARLAPGTPKADVTTQTGALVGTPRYMSPEQISGQQVDFRSDLWALGVIAFESITGLPLFSATEIGPLVLEICTLPVPVPSQVAPVPDGFDEWFACAVARDPQKRFFSARALAEELQAVCTVPGFGFTPSEGRLMSPVFSPQATTQVAAHQTGSLAKTEEAPPSSSHSSHPSRPSSPSIPLGDSRPSVLEPVVRSTGGAAMPKGRRRLGNWPLILGGVGLVAAVAAILLAPARGSRRNQTDFIGRAPEALPARNAPPETRQGPPEPLAPPARTTPTAKATPPAADTRLPVAVPVPQTLPQTPVSKAKRTKAASGLAARTPKGKNAVGPKGETEDADGPAPQAKAPTATKPTTVKSPTSSPSAVPLDQVLDQRR